MGMTKADIKTKYPEIVDFSGVGEFINLPMKTYSSGMGSRLRFAIAAAKDYEILLIDEALATGDAEFRVKSHARIDELRHKAGTVFLSAHDLGRSRHLQPGDLAGPRQDHRAGGDVISIIDRYRRRAASRSPGPGNQEADQRPGARLPEVVQSGTSWRRRPPGAGAAAPRRHRRHRRPLDGANGCAVRRAGTGHQPRRARLPSRPPPGAEPR
jgi:hypothetical protein